MRPREGSTGVLLGYLNGDLGSYQPLYQRRTIRERGLSPWHVKRSESRYDSTGLPGIHFCTTFTVHTTTSSLSLLKMPAASVFFLALFSPLALAATRLGTNTELHLAAVANKLSDVERLLASGADVNAKGEFGWTPLALAANNGHCPVMRILLDAGAQPNDVDETGHTALQYAAQNGYWEASEILLQGEADLSLTDRVRGEHGVQRDRQQSVTYTGLLCSQEGLTPLHLAAAEGHHDTVSLLLEWGADTRAVSNTVR